MTASRKKSTTVRRRSALPKEVERAIKSGSATVIIIKKSAPKKRKTKSVRKDKQLEYKR